MTDRQIQVLKIVNGMLISIDLIMNPDNKRSGIIEEFSRIIDEQEELNYASFKDRK